MDTVDAVAQAICENYPGIDNVWDELSDYGKDCYRKQARAAIDALGLTTEERRLHNGQQVCSRLVSGWVRKDNTNE